MKTVALTVLLVGAALCAQGSGTPRVPEPAGQESSKAKPSREQLPPAKGTLRVTTTLVEVTVVARDKHGQFVTDLKQDNFELYDEGKRQKIQFFTVQRARAVPVTSVAPAPPSSVALPARVFSNRSSENLGSNAVTVILIDEINMRLEDWPYARGQLIQFLGQAQPGDRIGVYLLLAEGFAIVHDFTQDCSALVKRLASWNMKLDQTRWFSEHPGPGIGQELAVLL